jgi:uncharacterized protein
MDRQEQDVIDGIFQRLEGAAMQQRDPEAETYISDKIRKQPYAPYAMAQSLFIQEQALTNLQGQVEALQREVTRLQNQPRSGGFLASLFGGASAQQRSPMQGSPMRGSQSQPSAAPWGQQQGGMRSGFGQPPMASGPWGARPGGGGFLQGAMATAVGVAGGMMLANALTSAFSDAEEAVSAAADPLASAIEPFTDSLPEAAPASFDQGGSDFGGSDFGGDMDMGGGDWA